jgi:SAM-dependent methyltransferase
MSGARADHAPPASLYDSRYYSGQIEGSSRAAGVVTPLVLALVGDTHTVVDIGCGTGSWLAAFKAAGVSEVLGLDGGVPDATQQMIAAEEYRRVDLERSIVLPRRFDLCLSLEVAEHLPPRRAESFIADLCALADVVLFGAAIPGQGGTNHVNECWPGVWAAIFADLGYRACDAIRPRIWQDERVEFWYRQNTLLYANEAGWRRLRLAAEAPPWLSSRQLDLVHPACFHIYRDELDWRRRQVEEQQTAQDALRAQCDELRRALTQARARIAALESEVTLLGRRCAEESAARDALRCERDASAAALASVLASTSWRLSAPLRGILHRLRRR